MGWGVVTSQEHASAQLARMRGMVGAYHRAFFADVKFAMVVVLALLAVGWWGVPELFLVVPFVCVWAATQTAFDASYLMFARHYAASLERWLNENGAEGVLVASALESAFLFPLHDTKLVTVPLRGPFSWFSFMTLSITANGLLAAAVGLWAGWDTLSGFGTVPMTVYVLALSAFTGTALVTGVWWFTSGVGERRLTGILHDRFGG